MPKCPYVSANNDKVLGIMKMYSRMGAYPLDSTSVFNTLTELNEYIHEPGSYAYPGQVIAVANGTVNSDNGDKAFSFYVIRSDKSVQEIGKNLVFSSTSEAMEYSNKNPMAFRPGETFTIGNGNVYELYTFKADGSLLKLSFDETTDIPTYSWENIIGAPTSNVNDIDDVVNFVKDNIAESDSGRLSYNENELAYMSDVNAIIASETKPESQAVGGIWIKIIQD